VLVDLLSIALAVALFGLLYAAIELIDRI